MAYFGKLLKLPVVFLAMGLAACSGLPSIDDLTGYHGRNYAAGAPIDNMLTGEGREALSEAFVAAMNAGETRSWRGRRGRGEVTPEGYALANLFADPARRIDLARPDLELNLAVETEQGLYALVRDTNLRTGPGTDHAVIEQLPAGTALNVVGRVVDKNWLLVAVDGAVRGFVYKNQAIKAPGTELELAGGPRRKPVLCRKFTQRARMFHDDYEWQGAACNDGTGWRLAPPDRSAAEEDDDEQLLEL